MLLDTDILIDLLRGKKEARDFLYSLPEDSLHCCSTITVAEIHSGMRESEREKTTGLIDSLIVLPVTREIAETAGKLKRESKSGIAFQKPKYAGKEGGQSETSQKLTGLELELNDCLIAATALVGGLELATRNKRHYPMPEVKVKFAEY